MSNRKWRVVVNTDNVGDIGSVHESTEELARAAALSKFGECSSREDNGEESPRAIYEDDDFSVFPA